MIIIFVVFFPVWLTKTPITITKSEKFVQTVVDIMNTVFFFCDLPKDFSQFVSKCTFIAIIMYKVLPISA